VHPRRAPRRPACGGRASSSQDHCRREWGDVKEHARRPDGAGEDAPGPSQSWGAPAGTPEPMFLWGGAEVTVDVAGLGRLTNRVAVDQEVIRANVR